MLFESVISTISNSNTQARKLIKFTKKLLQSLEPLGMPSIRVRQPKVSLKENDVV